jgi:hypothetical protein
VIAAVLAASLAGLPADLVFEPWFVDRGVAVGIARRPDGVPWIQGVADVPAPAPRVFAEVSRYENFVAFFGPVVRKARILDASGPEAVIHLVWDYPFLYRDRDAVVAYRGEELGGGVYRLSWREVKRPDIPTEGVRIARVAGETLVDALGADRCRVTYTYLADLGGRFPKAAEELAWRREPVGYVLAIRRSLQLPMPPR